MAGFNTDLELGSIARDTWAIQSKNVMYGIKRIYLWTIDGQKTPRITAAQRTRVAAPVMLTPRHGADVDGRNQGT